MRGGREGVVGVEVVRGREDAAAGAVAAQVATTETRFSQWEANLQGVVAVLEAVLVRLRNQVGRGADVSV